MWRSGSPLGLRCGSESPPSTSANASPMPRCCSSGGTSASGLLVQIASGTLRARSCANASATPSNRRGLRSRHSR
ncbi:hypothetical protein G6F50_017945 [Rhizopus delemar]|uniref:Uncharacterized protein n=1 Tax=Rhizopus delemar TaxID=936053 RepID=A0A9P6XP82_9FUNG|nr:hypothetical protein G6F23_015646 [Rhizopus arrhizus]KAG1529520.1 hypothetical protein G6F50_017945 [Rhizopus delemar]